MIYNNEGQTYTVISQTTKDTRLQSRLLPCTDPRGEIVSSCTVHRDLFTDWWGESFYSGKALSLQGGICCGFA